MPFGETFWSPGFGSLVDRFGVPWMVNVIPSADWRPQQGRSQAQESRRNKVKGYRHMGSGGIDAPSLAWRIPTGGIVGRFQYLVKWRRSLSSYL